MGNKEIHYRYGISFLLIVIIQLIAFAYFDVPQLVDKFSFALTISSLILAILAIFYTVASGDKQSNQLEKILEANATLSNVVKDIQNATESVTDLTQKIPEHFSNIHNKIDSFASSYQGLTKVKIDEMAEEPIARNVECNDLTSFKAMLGRMHFRSMLIIYLFQSFKHRGIKINLGVFESLDISSSEYAVGTLSGFCSTGLIEFAIHSDVIIPTHCAQVVTKNIEDVLNIISEVVGEDSKMLITETIEKVKKFK